PALTLAVILLAAIGASLALYELDHRARDLLPSLVVDAIPSRLINLHYALSAALIAACLASWQPKGLYLVPASFLLASFHETHFYVIRKTVLICALISLATLLLLNHERTTAWAQACGRRIGDYWSMAGQAMQRIVRTSSRYYVVLLLVFASVLAFLAGESL